jgi:DNA helicase-2/ATP-dependent DNA helicase PcrA
MAWDNDLEGAALHIAETHNSPLRVMAGPGTGKSFAMKRRVARLLEEETNPSRILAVTFTRNAAANLVEDLRELDVPGCEDIRAGTLHAFCFEILHREAVFGYLNRIGRPLITFTAYGILRYEASPMLKDLENNTFGKSRECTTRIRAFEAAWARLQSEEPGWPEDRIDRQFHIALVDWLRFHNAMLIGELIPEALRFLRNNPESPIRTAFDHIIVDEFQDLNRAEQDLIDLLTGVSQVAIVGDEDQSIYSFRHANPEGILEYSTRHIPTYDEELVECRRCPKLVVRMANHLIMQNHPNIEEPKLEPFDDNPEGEVHLVQWRNIREEANGLAQFVRHLIDMCGYEPGDVIILSPRRLIGYAIRDTLRISNIPVHSFYHEEALETDEAQWAFTLLTLLVNPDDRVALRWWLGLGSPSWRKGQYSRLRDYCIQNNLSPRKTLQMLLDGEIQIKQTNQLLDRYVEMINELERLEELNCEHLTDQLFPENENWARPLREAAILALESFEEPKELLDVLRTSITQPEMPTEGDFVRIMSLHKSKGLTSRVVIISDCIEGVIPGLDDNLTPQQMNRSLQEQRRLFYVAITRCRDVLMLSSVSHLDNAIAYRLGARIRRSGRTISSRFLDELGNECPRIQSGNQWIENHFEYA